MPQQLEVVTCADDYTDEATATFQLPTFRLSLIVGNASVAMQFYEVPPGYQAQAGFWRDPPELVIPGAGGFSRPFLIGGVRFKNYVPGEAVAGVVSCRAG